MTTSRAAALSEAVALVAGHRFGVDVPPSVTGSEVDPTALLMALVELGSMLAEHAGHGEIVLAVVGRVAAWVESGAADVA